MTTHIPALATNPSAPSPFSPMAPEEVQSTEAYHREMHFDHLIHHSTHFWSVLSSPPPHQSLVQTDRALSRQPCFCLQEVRKRANPFKNK
jgi:hypothetical protein